MLVDDEAPFVETMTKRLGKRDLNVIAAFSGQEAIETLEKHGDMDVVILLEINKAPLKTTAPLNVGRFCR
jgi:CheY-like chemotaxis protein